MCCSITGENDQLKNAYYEIPTVDFEGYLNKIK